MKKNVRFIFLILGSIAMGLAVWALLRFTAPRLHSQSTSISTSFASSADPDKWARAVERVKEDRGETAGQGGIEVPTELRHYEDRRWFLATQVAEVRKQNLHSCQDFVDLAGMIQRGEMVSVPAVTDDYVLFGVGAKADDDAFTRYEDDHSIGLYSDTQLRDEYARLDATRVNLQTTISKLKTQTSAPGKSNRNHARELQKQITTYEQELKSAEEKKALLDQFYGKPESRQQLLQDYEALQSLARNFGGRTFDLNNPTDRQAMKTTMLSSLRPEAFKIMQEIAAAYHRAFDRPLPVSSLVRPEQYQHVLRRVNRNATLIDTPPHSTGLAFDIDYRYMSAAEQAFVMTELARLKTAGRIEVLRERNANYHVFAFVDGVRPGDDLILAAADEISPPEKEADSPEEKPTKVKAKPQKVKKSEVKAKKPQAKSKKGRRK